MKLLRNNVFMIAAVLFMMIGLVRTVRGGDGAATWIALGAVFIALGASRMKKNNGNGGDNAG